MLQLLEMGFSRAACIDALTYTQTLEEATEYLLTTDVVVPGGLSPTPMEVGLTYMLEPAVGFIDE